MYHVPKGYNSRWYLKLKASIQGNITARAQGKDKGYKCIKGDWEQPLSIGQPHPRLLCDPGLHRESSSDKRIIFESANALGYINRDQILDQD